MVYISTDSLGILHTIYTICTCTCMYNDQPPNL